MALVLRSGERGVARLGDGERRSRNQPFRFFPLPFLSFGHSYEAFSANGLVFLQGNRRSISISLLPLPLLSLHFPHISYSSLSVI